MAAENCCIRSCAPSGLADLLIYPGLAPWAVFLRRFAAGVGHVVLSRLVLYIVSFLI